MANTKIELVKELENIVSQREAIGVTDNSKIKVIIEKAKKGVYHDFETPLATPKVQLVSDLKEVKLKLTDDIAQRVVHGEFDEWKKKKKSA